MSVTWSVPPVNNGLTQYYFFQVQYRQGSNTWINATIILNYNALMTVDILGLQRGILYELRILPLRTQNNITAADSASIAATLIIRKY